MTKHQSCAIAVGRGPGGDRAGARIASIEDCAGARIAPIEDRTGARVAQRLVLEGQRPGVRCPAPKLGENHAEILRAPGYRPDEINRVRQPLD